MRWHTRLVACLAAALVLSACDATPSGPDPGDLALKVSHGRLMFGQECASCHTSNDGLDLAFFNFSDTTIIRRALGHVDLAAAEAIVAYLHTLGVERRERDLRLFQPGGRILPSDLRFAIELFGEDAWPAGLTTDELSARDPLQIAAGVPLPLWSVEESNVDWMPDRAPPAHILDDQNGRARTAMATYRTTPSGTNLVRAVNALRTAERRVANPSAPCLLDSLTRVDFEQCFEVRRWTAALAAQHLIRNGLTLRLDRAVHDVWWEVGNVARKAIAAKVPFANAERIWAEWMYLGWIFQPASFASTYTGNGLLRLGLARHATFVALRSEVVRPRGSQVPYADVESAARFAPAHWAYHAVRFGLTHLLERQQAGDLPAVETRVEARMKIDNALTAVSRKVTAAQRAELQRLTALVVAGIP